MGSGVPFLNEYKLDFFWKRFPQTVLGGPKLRLGYDAPVYVYINQIILFLFPWILGGLFTILIQYDIVVYDIAMYVVGALIICFALTVQCVSKGIQRKHISVAPLDQLKFKSTDEEDEIEFMSCCGVETVSFAIPGKKFILNIFLHSFLCGPLVALGMWYLLPDTLNNIYSNNAAATWIIFIFGWITLCISTYSLIINSTPETAIFRSVDHYEIFPMMRAFYVMAFIAIDFLSRSFDSLEYANYIVHILFTLLPVFWTIGLLPPLDALFLWLFEQAHVILFGGSPMASDIRSVLMLLASCCVFLLVFFVPQGLQTIILMAGLGYIMSTNICGLFAQIINVCMNESTDIAHNNDGFLWRWGFREVFYNIAMLIATIGIAAVVNYFCQISDTLDYTEYIGFALIGLLIVELIFADMQSVYAFLGLWRNKLYPNSVQRTNIFSKKKRHLKVIGTFRRILIDFVCPVLMLVYISMSVKFPMDNLSTVSNSPISAIEIMGTSRSFRWIWQGTQNSLLEISVVHILKVSLPADSLWSSVHIGVQLLILGFVRDRLSQIIDKLYFYWTTLITSWSEKKQRRKSSAAMIVVNLILLPVTLGVICLAATLSAPLLPLFTLPVFLVGFPRPIRTWPEKVGTSANKCPDTVFYEQAAPHLAMGLRNALALGSIGEPSPGKHFLIRFQDRMAWVQILERGYGYCVISLKGLELQETSCHTVEATRIDDIIEYSFEFENGVPCCQWNKYALNTLRPFDAAYIKTMSDAKNQLTGVIDSPDVLRSIISNYRKTLVWVVVHHIHKKSQNVLGESYDPDVKVREEQQFARLKVPLDPLDSEFRKKAEKSNSKENKRPSSVNSFSDSPWSDDDSLFNEVLGDAPNKSPQKSNEPVKLEKTVLDRKSAAIRRNLVFDDEDNFNEQLASFSLPPVKPEPVQKKPSTSIKKTGSNRQVPTKGANINSSSLFTSPHSNGLSLPSKWHDIPVDVLKLNAEETNFPTEWFKHVISGLYFDGKDQKSPAEIALEVSGDRILAKMYSHFVGACHLIINELGLSSSDAVSLGAKHVMRIYNGNIPWSTATDWLTSDRELKALSLKAYRYSVKLSIDELLLGPVSSEEEMSEYMSEYDSDWFIGAESEPEWMKAIKSRVPQLFSLSYDSAKKTYNSRVLTSQDTAVYICTLNPEAVRGQWANLNLELFYMTNDDEERYSIQAHPTLLRNLIVQAADPPLGYPIYASLPITVPTL